MTHQGAEPTFPTALGRLLYEQGRRQEWLARQIGVDKSHVSRWATGERRIPLHHIAPISRALGVERNELFR